jgi:hypothetical protein
VPDHLRYFCLNSQVFCLKGQDKLEEPCYDPSTNRQKYGNMKIDPTAGIAAAFA